MTTPNPAPTTLRIAVIPGDGIGTEVVPAAIDILREASSAHGLSVETTQFDLGARRWHRTGDIVTDEDLHALAEHDAIMLGAIGDPSVPSGLLERGLLLRVRFAFDQYVNLRPTRLLPGVESPLRAPGNVDFVVVREGTEGPYVGNGGSMRTGTPFEVATEVSINTAVGIERVVRFAFAQAETRNRRLTLVHKHNVLVHAGALWQRIVAEVGAEHPEVNVDYLHVDAAMIHLVTDPSRFDVIVTDNLFGDIITDLAGAIGGGIGLSASANINPTGAFPSMFEPVHGSAPDIAGQGIADPTAAILSAALLLEHHGHLDAATQIRAAVDHDLESRRGLGARTTSEIAAAIRKALN